MIEQVLKEYKTPVERLVKRFNKGRDQTAQVSNAKLEESDV